MANKYPDKQFGQVIRMTGLTSATRKRDILRFIGEPMLSGLNVNIVPEYDQRKYMAFIDIPRNTLARIRAKHGKAMTGSDGSSTIIFIYLSSYTELNNAVNKEQLREIALKQRNDELIDKFDKKVLEELELHKITVTPFNKRVMKLLVRGRKLPKTLKSELTRMQLEQQERTNEYVPKTNYIKENVIHTLINCPRRTRIITTFNPTTVKKMNKLSKYLEIKVLIVPMNYPNKKLTDNHIDLITSDIVDHINLIKNNDVKPIFLRSRPFRGGLMVVCKNGPSYDWLKYALPRLSTVGMKLRTIKSTATPAKIKVMGRIKYHELMEPETIQNLLRVQNTLLDASKFKVVGQKLDGNRLTIFWMVDSEGFAVLKRIQFLVNIGMEQVVLTPVSKKSN